MSKSLSVHLFFSAAESSEETCQNGYQQIKIHTTKSSTLTQNKIPKSLMFPNFQNPLIPDIKGYTTRHKIVKIPKSAIRTLEINSVWEFEIFYMEKTFLKTLCYLLKKNKLKIGVCLVLEGRKKMLLFSQEKQRKQIWKKKYLYLLLLLGVGLSDRHF